jgi:hypothetical protein
LRRSPVTPAALRARQLNSFKSTGPRTARGKAWSCLNALRHGQRSRRRTFRDKLARTGDSEAVYLFDLIFEELLNGHENPTDFVWRRLESLAVRAWCIESGRRGRKAAKTCLRTKLESGVRFYRYGEKFVVPRRLKITNKAGWGFMLLNPVPSRRRRVASGWIPQVQDLEGTPPKARRVRGTCEPETQMVRSGRNRSQFFASRDKQGVQQSCWGTICKAIGRFGSSIFRKLAVAAVSLPPSSPPPSPLSSPPSLRTLAGFQQPAAGPEAGNPRSITGDRRGSFETDPSLQPPFQEFWDDPDDDDPVSREEAMLRDKFIATLTEAAAQASRRVSGRR